MSEDQNSNDIVLHVGTKELFRLTIPGSQNKVVAVQANFLPGDNRKLTDFTVQLSGGGHGDEEVEVQVVESQGFIGFAPNPSTAMRDEDDDDDPEDE